MKHISLRHKIFNVLNVTILSLFAIICIYPFFNTLAIALNEGNDSLLGGLTFYPRKFTLNNFVFVLNQITIQKAFVVSILRVIVGVTATMIVQFAAAYAATKPNLPGKKFIIFLFMIPMFIPAPLIPRYVLYSQIGLLGNFLVYILPGMFAFYSFVVLRANINAMPVSLFESARLDGASDFKILFKIVIPLSLPILATLSLWAAVGHWSDWTTTLYFAASNKNIFTLQYYIRLFLVQAQTIAQMISQGKLEGVFVIPVSIQAAQVMITTIPIVCLYPFLQKYFISGVMVGSVKE
jgi:putative aldouronate transport system permease protein